MEGVLHLASRLCYQLSAGFEGGYICFWSTNSFSSRIYKLPKFLLLVFMKNLTDGVRKSVLRFLDGLWGVLNVYLYFDACDIFKTIYQFKPDLLKKSPKL